MANMLSATKELVLVKAAMSNKQDELRMRTDEKWMKMASIYAMCGQHDLALATMKQIEDDEAQQVASDAACNQHNLPKEVEEERTTSGASDQHHCKENAWDFNGNKWYDVIETGKAAVESGETATDALCIECKQTPSLHKCRYCKQFVCDPCPNDACQNHK